MRRRVLVAAVAMCAAIEPAVCVDSVAQRAAVCDQILEAVDARRVNCSGLDRDVYFGACGVTGLDTFSVRSLVYEVLGAVGAEIPLGATLQPGTWESGVEGFAVSIEGEWISIDYSPDTGLLATSFLKPVPLCRTTDHLFEPEQLIIGKSSSFYPNLAKAARIEGTVLIGVDVDPEALEETLCVMSVSKPNLGFEVGAFLAAKDALGESRPVPLGGFEVRFELATTGAAPRSP